MKTIFKTYISLRIVMFLFIGYMIWILVQFAAFKNSKISYSHFFELEIILIIMTLIVLYLTISINYNTYIVENGKLTVKKFLKKGKEYDLKKIRIIQKNISLGYFVGIDLYFLDGKEIKLWRLDKSEAFIEMVRKQIVLE